MSCSSRCVATERRALLVALAGGLFAGPLRAAPAADLKPVGQGRLRWFGLEVYEARLWAGEGVDSARTDRGPLALELRYARALRGRDIAERSLQEMRRGGPIDDSLAGAWLALMQRAFPDVRAGERLTGLLRDGRLAFSHDGRPTADTDDLAFAQRFLGIWLAEWTSQPALRRALLGAGS